MLGGFEEFDLDLFLGGGGIDFVDEGGGSIDLADEGGGSIDFADEDGSLDSAFGIVLEGTRCCTFAEGLEGPAMLLSLAKFWRATLVVLLGVA